MRDRKKEIKKEGNKYSESKASGFCGKYILQGNAGPKKATLLAHDEATELQNVHTQRNLGEPAMASKRSVVWP